MNKISDEIEATTEAIERGTMNADDHWKETALYRLRQVASATKIFTANDVRDAMAHDSAKTHDARAMGGVFKAAQKLGWIERTGEAVNSDKAGCHGAYISRWRSLLI